MFTAFSGQKLPSGGSGVQASHAEGITVTPILASNALNFEHQVYFKPPRVAIGDTLKHRPLDIVLDTSRRRKYHEARQMYRPYGPHPSGSHDSFDRIWHPYVQTKLRIRMPLIF